MGIEKWNDAVRKSDISTALSETCKEKSEKSCEISDIFYHNSLILISIKGDDKGVL